MLRRHCNNAVFKQLVTSTWLNEGFVQAIGAMTPAATAFMALALLGTVEKAVTYMTLVPVMAGIILATGFEPSFNSFGFLAAVGACGARAFKAVLQVNPRTPDWCLTHSEMERNCIFCSLTATGRLSRSALPAQHDLLCLVNLPPCCAACIAAP